METNETSEYDEPSDERHGEGVSAPGRRRRRIKTKARSHFAAVQRPRWEAWVLALIPLLVCFLGGGRSVFAKGVALSCAGLFMLMAAPGYRLPKVLLVAFGVLIAAPLLSFLPAVLLSPLPEWRSSLAEDWGIALASSATPQPWVTLESWLLFVSGFTWLAWCSSRGSTLEDRRIILRLLTVGLAVIAVLTLCHKAKLVEILWWKFPPELGNTYGPFANRNHTSSLMAMAGILCVALTYDSYRNKQRTWMLFLVLLVPFFLVILSNTSRAGVLLFFLGITIWLWTATMRKSAFKKTALIGALVLGGISVVLVFGGTVTTRLKSSLGAAPSGENGRSVFYSDVMKMTSQSPWTGVGLGNFVDVYPHSASFHEPRMRFLHPESDLFWLMSEGGMITLICAVAVILMMMSMTGPWSNSRDDESGSRQDRRLRHAASIAAAMSIVHGVVDVPNHSLGYGLLSSMLLAVGLRPSRVRTPAGQADRLGFRVLGLCILGVGAALLAIFFGRPLLPGRSAAKLCAQQARVLSAANRDTEALALANRALGMNPLDWTLYFLRATLSLKLNRPDQDALLDFGRARAIEPHYAMMCIEEADVWLGRRSRFAVQAWKEFFRRQPDQTGSYNLLLERVANDPDLRREARKLATTSALKLICLRWTPASPEFDELIGDLVKTPKGLEALEPEGRLEFFRLWQQRGDRDALKAGLQKNAFWQQDGWRVLCEELAKDGNYEGAFRMAVRFEPPPISPSVSDLHDFGELQHNFDLNPIDPRRGIDLYFAQKDKALWDAALATLEKVAGLPGAPSYIGYEKAVVFAQKHDYRKAWELMTRYLTDRSR
ncbi:MAG: O-antigen ligase family protein [Verrucomicrobiaceae bacterium]|nr:O-antigen ligase family protein [Verrucomicrobiaceae bacterium]